MVKHIILWTLKNEYTDSEKAEIKLNIKKNLEGLAGKLDGLIDIAVHTNGLASSTSDIMLDSTFENADSLKRYSSHELHVAVANRYVRPYTAIRSCFDYEI